MLVLRDVVGPRVGLKVLLKMKKNGKIAIEILIMLVTVVVTSGIIFLLIQGISEVLKCVYAVKNRRWP